MALSWRLEGLRHLLRQGIAPHVAHMVEAALAQTCNGCGDYYDLNLREAVEVWKLDKGQTAPEIVHQAAQPLPVVDEMTEDEKAIAELTKRKKHAETASKCSVCVSDLVTQENKQLRAPDEGETQFRKCLKCKHKWETKD